MNNTDQNHWGVTALPEQSALQAELDRLASEAEAKRREIEARQAVINARQRDWTALLQAGQAAAETVRHAREQVAILREQLAALRLKFDGSVGGFYLSRDWFTEQRADPMLSRSVVFPPPPWSADAIGEHPHVAAAKEVVAREWAIARIESLLPAFERAEFEALRAARAFAKEHGIEHPFPAEKAAPEPPAGKGKTK